MCIFLMKQTRTTTVVSRASQCQKGTSGREHPAAIDTATVSLQLCTTKVHYLELHCRCAANRPAIDETDSHQIGMMCDELNLALLGQVLQFLVELLCLAHDPEDDLLQQKEDELFHYQPLFACDV